MWKAAAKHHCGCPCGWITTARCPDTETSCQGHVEGQWHPWTAKWTGFCSQPPEASLDQAKGKSCGPAFSFMQPVRGSDAIRNKRSLLKGGRRRKAVHKGIWRLRVYWSQMCYRTEEHVAGRVWRRRLSVLLTLRCKLSNTAVAARSFRLIRTAGLTWMSISCLCHRPDNVRPQPARLSSWPRGWPLSNPGLLAALCPPKS